MDAKTVIELIIMFMGAAAFWKFIEYLITRNDTKHDSNKTILDRLDSLENKIDENQAILARTHILRFADELKNNVYHSDEYFRQQLADCDTYEHYCKEHEGFKNGYTELSSQYIKDTYKRLLEEHRL